MPSGISFMRCYGQAASHYLSQCWLLIYEVLWSGRKPLPGPMLTSHSWGTIVRQQAITWTNVDFSFMRYYSQAASHYLSQCWLLIYEVLWSGRKPLPGPMLTSHSWGTIVRQQAITWVSVDFSFMRYYSQAASHYLSQCWLLIYEVL